jgi:hypothetical protein
MRVSVVVLLILLSTMAAFGCNPAVPTVCQAYTRAEAVFVGTLLSVDEVPRLSPPRVEAKFTVNKIYKGKPNPIELVRFQTDYNCGPKLPKIGGQYFVYQEPFSSGVANLTREYFPTMDEVKFAEGIAQRKTPVYSIGGQFLQRLTPEEISNVSITITGQDGIVRKVPLSDNGYFELTVTKTGDYAVRVHLPRNTAGWATILNSMEESSGNHYYYTVTFSPNDCDFREFRFSAEDASQR